MTTFGNYGLPKLPNELRKTNTEEKCNRCNGKGNYTVTLGEPGQDTRVDGGYSLQGIRWTAPRGPYQCEVCQGKGTVKKQRTTTIGHYVIEDETHQFTGEHKYGN